METKVGMGCESTSKRSRYRVKTLIEKKKTEKKHEDELQRKSKLKQKGLHTVKQIESSNTTKNDCKTWQNPKLR